MITKKTQKQMQQAQAHLAAGNNEAALRMIKAIRRAAYSPFDTLYLDMIILDLEKQK
jgi:hypothetical protein